MRSPQPEAETLLSRRHNRNEFGFRWRSWGRSRLPAFLPPGDFFVSDVGPPAARMVFFRRWTGHCSAQVTHQCHRESERFLVVIRTSQQKLSRSDARVSTVPCRSTMRGTNEPTLGKESSPFYWFVFRMVVMVRPSTPICARKSAAIASRSTTRSVRCTTSAACSYRTST